VETPVDGPQVSPIAGNGAGGHALAAIEPLEGGGAVLAELARAVEHDLATPDHAPATERAYAHDWADFAAFCGRHGLDSGDVARVLRRRTASAGIAGDFAGHSLQRGFITNAAKKKVPIENIKRVTGQRSSGIVLDYIATATIDDEPPLLEILA